MGCCDMTVTAGVTSYDDTDTAALTLQSLRAHQGYATSDKLELIAVDNNPESRQGQRLKAFCAGTGVRYIPFPTPRGTTAPRDEIFRQAKHDLVVVCDSHVMFPSGTIQQLARWAKSHPEGDLWMGPMLRDDMRSVYATHMEPRWGTDRSFGVWETDQRGTDPKAEPFDIPAQGLGAFACRREAWQFAPTQLSGYSCDEWPISEKFRRNGKRVLCLPFFRWWHWFRDQSRPASAPVTINDRFRNYLIWFRHLGVDESQLWPVFEVLGDRREKIAESVGAVAPLSSPVTPSLPPVTKMALNYAWALVKHAATGMQHVDGYEYHRRLDICQGCELRAGDRCTDCGCWLKEKALWKEQRCGVGKWDQSSDLSSPLTAGASSSLGSK